MGGSNYKAHSKLDLPEIKINKPKLNNLNTRISNPLAHSTREKPNTTMNMTKAKDGAPKKFAMPGETKTTRLRTA